MSDVRISVDYAAVGAELLKSEWTREICNEAAAVIAEKVEGAAVEEMNGGTRLYSAVFLENCTEEKADELLRAVT